jgi:hypothetical protein
MMSQTGFNHARRVPESTAVDRYDNGSYASGPDRERSFGSRKVDNCQPAYRGGGVSRDVSSSQLRPGVRPVTR